MNNSFHSKVLLVTIFLEFIYPVQITDEQVTLYNFTSGYNFEMKSPNKNHSTTLSKIIDLKPCFNHVKLLSSSGGMAREATVFYKQLAERVSQRRVS